MTNQTRSVENLQKALAMEMTAIHQYLLHAHVIEDWGLDALAEKMRERDERGAWPCGSLHRPHPLSPGRSRDRSRQAAQAGRGAGRSLRRRSGGGKKGGAIAFYAEAAKAADEDRDIGTRVLFEEILMDEEGHKDWLAQQLSLLERMGEPTFMLKNMSDGAGGA